MARTHKELGLFKPSDRASQMGAVRREHGELIALNPFHPAGQSCGLPVRLPAVGIFVDRQAHCSLREVCNRSKREPDPRTVLDQAGEDESDDWQPDHEARNRVENEANLKQKISPRGIAFYLRGRWGMTFRFVWCHYWFEVRGCVPLVASAVLAICPGAGPCRRDAS